jgi:(R,R)-butanediol dehydrogenase/meso-butanediol dehydrogenase/diacetyl reductase
MRAAVYCGKEDIQVREVAAPEIGAGEILVRVQYGGICGTDVAIYNGKHLRAQAPLVPGHEVFGRIDAIGSAVQGEWKKGMRVAIFPLIPCGRCTPCREGRVNVCETLRMVGIDRDGGFAEFLKVGPENVVAIPDSVTDEQAAVMEPLAVGVHAVENSLFRTGDTALVTGGGPIGNLVAQVLRASGAREVIVSEMKPYRRDLAARMGFPVFDPAGEHAQQALQRLLGSRFVDIVFEASGYPAAYQDAVQCCKVRGQINFVGVPRTMTEIDILGIVFKEISSSSSRVYRRRDYLGAIALLSRGAIDVLQLLDKVALSDAPSGFQRMKAADTSLKLLLVP